jgi:CHAD domain-containing protein
MEGSHARTARISPSPRASRPTTEEGSPSIEQTRAVLLAQHDRMVEHEPGTRLGADPEDLHQMRVATRRARAVLRVARPLLDAERVDELRAELKWLGTALGQVRDLDVLIAHLREEATSLGDEDGFAAQRIVHALETEREQARGALIEALESERYSQLIDGLEGAVGAPLGEDPGVTLSDLAAAEFKRLRKAARSLDRSSSDADLHRARIKAKRARYAAELAEPIVGTPATRFIKKAKRFQDVGGEHQDAVVAEQRIRAVVGSARASKVAFAAGRLVEREREIRRDARTAMPKAWAALERAGRKAWS